MVWSVLRFIAKGIIFVSFFSFCIHYWLLRKSYLFSEEDVAAIARKYVGEIAAEVCLWCASKTWSVQVV